MIKQTLLLLQERDYLVMQEFDMKNIYLLCFFVNVGLLAWALSTNVGLASIALSLVCAGLCLSTYLRYDA